MVLVQRTNGCCSAVQISRSIDSGGNVLKDDLEYEES